MHKATELKQQRAALVGEVRKITEAANNGSLTPEQRSTIDKIELDLGNLEKDIGIAERQERREAELRATEGTRVTGENPKNDAEKREADYREAFRKYLTRGIISPALEQRDLAADTANVGGNVIVPQQFEQTLIKDIENVSFIRALATKIQLGAASNVGIPTLTGDVEDGDWTTEVAAVDNDTGIAFGKRTMTPTMLTKLVKASIKFLTINAVGGEAFINSRLVYKFGITEEKNFLTGDGSGKPLGLFTASASGISTARDLVAGNSATAIGADSLQEQVYNIKKPYRRNAKWLFHRDAIKMIRKLKDTTNQYLWQPSVAAGQPDTLLGYEVMESEYAPNTFTTGLYVGLFGDFSNYWVVDQLGMSIQRLNEKYADTNQVGFIARKSTDGAPAQELAFSRIKLG